MSRSTCLTTGLALLSLAVCVPSVSAQKVEATVLYRQASDNSYTAVIPGPDGSAPEGVVDCAADIANPACLGATPLARSGSGPAQPSLNVSGTTLSLLLPDGRVAVVNCATRYSFKRDYINRRMCAMPLVEHVEANFNGQSARLKWPVGQDGRKTESENYKLVALLNKR
jgi:hypothetical protein